METGMRLRFSRTMRLGVVTAVAGLWLTGCASTPSSDDLAASILRAAEADPSINLTNEEAGCMAGIFLDAGLSDTTLEGLAENFDQPTVLAAEQDQIEPLVTEAALKCAS